MDFFDYRLVAHRGLYNNARGIPENSMAAFSRAVDYNVAIELDVHLTRDHYLVVFHDGNLKRMTGHDKAVEDCTLKELKKLRLLDSPYTVPGLDEVLAFVDGKVPLLIEVKDESFNGKLEMKLFQQLQNYSGKYIVESFNPFVLYWFKKHAPYIIRGQLSSRDFPDMRSGIKRWVLRSMIFNQLTKPHFISYNVNDISEAFALRCRREKRALFAWTVSNYNLLEKAAGYCDGIIFEGLPLEEVKFYAGASTSGK